MIAFEVDLSGIMPWRKATSALAFRAARRAGTEAVKGMRAESSRQIRQRKAMKATILGQRLSVVYPRSADDLSWAVKATGGLMPVYAFMPRQNRKGTSVQINKGSRKTIAHSFIATMKSGHTGVFMRYGQATRVPVRSFKGHARYAGQKRQPIRELFTTRVSEAFTDAAQPIADRGAFLFQRAFSRNLRAR